MATGDPDGRRLQDLSDRLVCLGMSMAEHLRDAQRHLDDLLQNPTDPDSTEETR